MPSARGAGQRITFMAHQNNWPKLHNAMWPGLVGKGPDSEPPWNLDRILELTEAADVGGVKFGMQVSGCGRTGQSHARVWSHLLGSRVSQRNDDETADVE
jgi:hypothetical protein